MTGFLLAVVMDEPTGGEGHEDHADAQDQAWHQLEAEGQKPSSFGLSVACPADVVSAVVDPERDHNACHDGKLLQ